MDRDEFEFPVVGSKYLDGADWLIGYLQIGDRLELVSATGNNDPYALYVTSAGEPIGYVPNKGTSCGKCWEPVHTHETWCRNCRATWSEFVKCGMAGRFCEKGILQQKYTCFVSDINEHDRFAQVTATLVLSNI